MTSLLLFGWAVAVGAALPRTLAGRAWTRSAPRLAIGLWLGAELSVVMAVLGSGLLLAGPSVAAAIGLDRFTGLNRAAGLDWLVTVCMQALIRLGSPNAVLAVVALVATATLAARLVVSLVRTYAGARRWRHRHRADLLPVARTGEANDTTVVDHPVPAVYCLPGRPGQIVVTSAALDALSPAEFAAVLRHERAHLRGRHHFLTAFVTAFHRAFPGLSLARTAEAEVRGLVEHLADDQASRYHDRRLVATAIVRLADATPEHALGAATLAAVRVCRMLAPARPLRTVHRLLAAGALGALLLLPLTTAVGSAVVIGAHGTCSQGSAASTTAGAS